MTSRPRAAGGIYVAASAYEVTEGSPGQFRLLFVCHANECRSAMAERLTQRAFADRFGPRAIEVRVTSAGTNADPGRPMQPQAADILRYYAAETGGFASRQLDQRLLTEADLVLTATREQRDICGALAPTMIGRIYPLKQFSRIALVVQNLSAVTAGSLTSRMNQLVAHVSQVRYKTPPASAADDLTDPIGQKDAAFRQCATDIQQSIDLIILAITLSQVGHVARPRSRRARR